MLYGYLIFTKIAFIKSNAFLYHTPNRIQMNWVKHKMTLDWCDRYPWVLSSCWLSVDYRLLTSCLYRRRPHRQCCTDGRARTRRDWPCSWGWWASGCLATPRASSRFTTSPAPGCSADGPETPPAARVDGHASTLTLYKEEPDSFSKPPSHPSSPSPSLSLSHILTKGVLTGSILSGCVCFPNCWGWLDRQVGLDKSDLNVPLSAPPFPKMIDSSEYDCKVFFDTSFTAWHSRDVSKQGV